MNDLVPGSRVRPFSTDLSQGDSSLGANDHFHRPGDAFGIDADGIDAELRQEGGDAGIVGRRLAANSDMPAVAVRPGHRQAQHFHDPGIALVEIERDELGVAIDAQDELCQVVRADREAVEQLGERIDLDDVVGNLA